MITARLLIVSSLILAVAALSATPASTGFSPQTAPKGGQFLVASEYFLRDPLFAESVILIIKHDEHGSVGLILNHPSKLTISQAIPQMSEQIHLGNPVSIGGPVSLNRFFMLARTSVTEEGLFRVMDQVAFSASPDSIHRWLSRVNGRKKIRVFAGYSGWTAGQLEAEIQQGAWSVLPASDESVFDTESSDLWRALTTLLPGHEEV